MDSKLSLYFLIGLIAFQSAYSSEVKIASTEPIYTNEGGVIKAKQYFYNPAENALLPWFQAMEWCQMQGYEPGRIDSAVENGIVARALNENFQTSRVFWLGGTDWGQDGQFYWIRTGENFRYNNFAAGYPNGGLPESCVYVWGDGLWYDQYCTVQEVRPLCQLVT